MSIHDTTAPPKNSGDVWLFNTLDNGDILVPTSDVIAILSAAEVGSLATETGSASAEVGFTTSGPAPASGDIATTVGYETAVYLSLFGGNRNDSTLDNDDQSWWGNAGEQNATRRVASRTQFLLESIPAIPANMSRIEAAIIQDLDWINAEINVIITMPANNRINIEVSIASESFVFIESWASQPTIGG